MFFSLFIQHKISKGYIFLTALLKGKSNSEKILALVMGVVSNGTFIPEIIIFRADIIAEFFHAKFMKTPVLDAK